MICDPHEQDCSNPALTQGLVYDSLVQTTSGASGSICDTNYDATMKAISANVAEIIQRQFTLTTIPDAGSLQVTIDGTPTTAFQLNNDQLTLNPGTKGTLLAITYHHGETPKFDRMTLSATPASGTLQVLVNSAELDPSSYTYDATANDVFFTNQPPDDAKVHITYKKNVALPSTFDASQMTIATAPLSVAVNGAAVTAYTYDPVAKKLSFPSAPSDGAAIAVTYRVPNGLDSPTTRSRRSPIRRT